MPINNNAIYILPLYKLDSCIYDINNTMTPQVFIRDGKSLAFFLVGLTLDEFYDYAVKIESLGGCVKHNKPEGIIILTPKVDIEDTLRYDIKYVDDCLRQGKLLDLSHYRLDVPSHFRGDALNDSRNFETNEEKVFPTPLASSSIQDEASSNLTARIGLHSTENSLESTEEIEESVSKKIKSSPTCHRSSPSEPEDPESCNSDDTIIIRPAVKSTKVAYRSNSAISTADRTLKFTHEELKLLKALSQQLARVNKSYGDASSSKTNRAGNLERASLDTDQTLLLSADEISRALRTKIEVAAPPQQTVTSSSQESEMIDNEVVIIESDPSKAKPPPELVPLDSSDDEPQSLPQSQANTLKNVKPPLQCPSSSLNISFHSHLLSRNNSMVSLPSDTSDEERNIQSSDTNQSPVASTSRTNGNSQRPKAANLHYMGMTFVEANPPTSESENDDDSDSSSFRRVNDADTVNRHSLRHKGRFIPRDGPRAAKRHRLRANGRFIPKSKGADDVNRAPLSPVDSSPPRQNILGSINTSSLSPEDVFRPRRNNADRINKPRPAVSEQALRQNIANTRSHPSPTAAAPPRQDNAGSVNRSPLLPGEASPPLNIIHLIDKLPCLEGRCLPKENNTRNVNRSSPQAGPSRSRRRRPLIRYSSDSDDAAAEPPAHRQRLTGNRNNSPRIHSSDSDASVADKPPARERGKREHGNNRTRILRIESEDSDDDEDLEDIWRGRLPTRAELEDFSWLFPMSADWRDAERRLEQRLSKRRERKHWYMKKFQKWEQRGMLWYIIKNDLTSTARAKPTWKKMNEDGYLKHRTPLSLLNNFMKSIRRNLNQIRMPSTIRTLFYYC